MRIEHAEREKKVLSRIERLEQLLTELEHVSTPLERAKIRERMRQELAAARVAIRTLGTHDSH